MNSIHLNRRGFLGMGAATLAIAALPKFALAAAGRGDTRFLLVLLRGGLDGVHALQAPGDAGYMALRGDFSHSKGQADSLKLDGNFSLHGALCFMASLYAQQQLLPMVAVAPPYRQRSHFEAQDCVENGTLRIKMTSDRENDTLRTIPINYE